MVRKCASFAFGLAIIVALGFAVAHAYALKDSGNSTVFSAPCEPPSPVFKAAGESKAVSTVVPSPPAEAAKGQAGVIRKSRVEMVGWAIPAPAPQAFPPLLHRPPPENS